MATKKELLAQEVAKAVGAGKAVGLETVDFNDPNRPKTCLGVDFPILSIHGRRHHAGGGFASRMQMVGNVLNPVAWFVIKQELANVDLGK